MKILHVILLMVIVVGLSGCTSVDVRAPNGNHDIDHVFIIDNPKVIVSDFMGVLREGFSRHGISSEVVDENTELRDKYAVTYTALRTWDFSPYLSHAEIRIERNGLIIASAEYHLRGKGGLSLTKWAGVKSKMDPVIDELIESFRR